MRLEVKKWGNGLALRVPKNHPDYGELRPGMEVEVNIGARNPKEPWEPVVEDMGPADLSENHRDYTAKLLDRAPWYEEYDS